MSHMFQPESASPYVISADVFDLTSRWADQAGLLVPSEAFFVDRTAALSRELADATGLQVHTVEHQELRDGLNQAIAASPHPVFSLDRAYIPDDHPGIHGFIDMTRAVGPDHALLPGTPPRPGKPTVTQQLEAMRLDDESHITLVDDVIFSGEGAVDLARQLKAVNRPVARLITGIGIGDGVRKLQDEGIEVVHIRHYESVADEVCERDFIAGSPMSGRTVMDTDGSHWSAPYMLPFGKPEQWASIPGDRTQDFSRFCLQQSIELWKEMGRLNGRHITVNEVPRRLQPSAATDAHTPFIDVLHQGLAGLTDI